MMMNNLKLKRALIGGVVCASWWLPVAPALGQPTNDKLLTFQKFVNGEIPIKEAIVYRTITKTNGVTINQEWWRFGYQDDTWYCQRLQPDTRTNNLGNLVAKANSAILGASSKIAWSLVGDFIQVSEIKSGTNSLLKKQVGVRNMMFSALSLGLPRILDQQQITDAHINWNGLEFKTIIFTNFGVKGEEPATSVLDGKLELGENGQPASAQYVSIGKFPGGSVTYQYPSRDDSVPNVFVAKYGGHVYRYEFLSLTLGRNDLSKTSGYVPAMFADMKIHRLITVWTNNRPYSLIDGKLVPAFGKQPAGEYKGSKIIASFIMIVLAVSAAIFLVPNFRRSK